MNYQFLLCLLLQLPLISSSNGDECINQKTIINYSFKTLKLVKNNIFTTKNPSCIKNIILSNNLLSEIPANVFSNITNLEYLDLSFNKFKKIPENVFVNTNIKTMNLAWNLINSEKKLFQAMPSSLTTLVLNGNPLNQLWSLELMPPMTHLFYLSAENCSLIFVDFREPLKEMKSLMLSKNRIQNLTSNTFSGVENLEYLDLSRNSIKKLPRKGFSGLEHLQYLWLSYNQIKKIENIFGSDTHTKMKGLFINDNELETILPNAFRSMNSLSVLNLRNNQLLTLNYNVFHSQATVGTLFMWGNPLDCSCDRRINIKWMSKNVHLSIAECATPTDLEGINWITMNDTDCI